MKVSEKAKQEAVQAAERMVGRKEPFLSVLRFLTTQLLAKKKLGPKEKRNLCVYEVKLDGDVNTGKLTQKEAVAKHVSHLERLASSRSTS